MRNETRYSRALRALGRYLVFFLLAAFLITCCTMLFVTVLSRTLGITLTEQNIATAAKLTFINVVVLSLIFTIIDAWRRRITVDRYVRCITEATERMMQGDLSVRIPTAHAWQTDDRLREIAECINSMAEELSSIETLRSDFISNVSHEFKTPLAVIGNYATLLQSPALDENERLGYAHAIADATHTLATLVTNVLRLNKLESQHLLPAATRYDLGEQLCECLLGFEEVWEERGILIETDIAQDVTVSADADMMTLVWNNLFSNALKFTEAGGRVTLRMFVEGDDAVVQIADTGCGISAEVGAHIFEKFYQGDTSHTTQGNGLGLALVKRVIDLTSSEIAVESEVGVGTTFTVRLRRGDR